ncbi:hypothetical protein LJR027_004297 [Terrabacter sp. LjRoot27]
MPDWSPLHIAPQRCVPAQPSMVTTVARSVLLLSMPSRAFSHASSAKR